MTKRSCALGRVVRLLFLTLWDTPWQCITEKSSCQFLLLKIWSATSWANFRRLALSAATAVVSKRPLLLLERRPKLVKNLVKKLAKRKKRNDSSCRSQTSFRQHSRPQNAARG